MYQMHIIDDEVFIVIKKRLRDQKKALNEDRTPVTGQFYHSGCPRVPERLLELCSYPMRERGMEAILRLRSVGTRPI